MFGRVVATVAAAHGRWSVQSGLVGRWSVQSGLVGPTVASSRRLCSEGTATTTAETFSAEDRRKTEQLQQEQNTRTVFVANLAYHTREEHIAHALSRAGEVEGVKVPRDFRTGLARGYAFVTFTDEDAAKRAKLELNGILIDGRFIVIRQPQPRNKPLFTPTENEQTSTPTS